jgi:DNA invertase Pin-like site-specific DNA recombinase
MQRAAIYCRVSTTGQEDNGSLGEQEQRCRTYCAEHGYAVLEPPYREVFTGEDLDRPQLDTLREQMRAGHVDVVVVDKVDRLSRMDPAIAAYVMVEAEQYGTKVEFCEVQDDSFEGQILTAVLSIVARVEHRRIKERTVAGRRRRIVGDPANGKPARLMPGNIPRYGWRYADADKSRYVLHPEQAQVMERFYREVGEDGRSVRSICRDLEREGVVPPAEALAREGYDIGKRRTSMRWHPTVVTRMLKEPCYWGEAVANRYENPKTTVHDPKTHRTRHVKRPGYRDPDSEEIRRYPPDVWPGIVSKEVAMKALARLAQNKIEAERNSKHIGLSFLRAGHIVCGHCGANMLLHNRASASGTTLWFICGRHVRFKGGNATYTEDCPSGGLVSVRVDMVEDAAWAGLVIRLSDPKRVPDAYAALMAKETDARERLARRTKTLTDLITKARGRLNRLADALADEDDMDMRALYKEKVATETASIRTWEQERKAIEAEAEETLAETAEVRDWMAEFLKRAGVLFDYNTAQRRKLARALNLRVAVYKPTHQPWIEMACDLPGIEWSWHAEPFAQVRAKEEAIAQKAGQPLPNLAARSPRQLFPVPDVKPQVSERVRSDAIPFDEGVDGDHIERAEEEVVDPDRHLPPDRPRHQHGIERVAPPVDGIYQRGGRPDRVGEVVRVGDDELLDIDDVRDEEEVHQEERQDREVARTLPKRDDALLHGLSPLDANVLALASPALP